MKFAINCANIYQTFNSDTINPTNIKLITNPIK